MMWVTALLLTTTWTTTLGQEMGELPMLFDNDCMRADANGGWNSPFFNESQVGRTDVTIDPTVLNTMLYSPKASKYYPADYAFSSPSGVAFSAAGIGIRIRGYSSRYMAGSKHSYTLNLGKADGATIPYGLRKVALRGEPFDPSMMREHLTCDVLRAMGVCHARKSYSQLYINDVYWGLFLMMEIIDDAFLPSRFGVKEGEGMLYKLPTWDTSYLGMNFWMPALQELYFQKEPLKSYKDSNLYSPLVHLASLPGITSPETFAPAMALALDVPLFLRSAAVLELLFDWDSIANGNNYYMAILSETNQVVFIPTDFDISIGFMSNTTECGTFYTFGCDPTKHIPLYNAIVASPDFRPMFTAYGRILVDKLLDGADAPIQKRISALRTLIEPFAVKPFFNDTHAPFPPSQESFDGSFVDRIYTGNDTYIAGISTWLDWFPMQFAETMDPMEDGLTIARIEAPSSTESDTVDVRVIVHGNVDVTSVTIKYELVSFATGETSANLTQAMLDSQTSPYSTTWVATLELPYGVPQGVFFQAVALPASGSAQPAVFPPNGSYRAITNFKGASMDDLELDMDELHHLIARAKPSL